MKIRYNSILLLSLLLSMVLFSPILESTVIGRSVMDVLFCSVTVAVVMTLDVRKSIRVFAAFLAIVILIVHITELVVFAENIFLTVYALSLLLTLLAFFSLMKSIVTVEFVSVNVIIDAISAYMLIGLGWALIFLIIHSFVPTAFDFGDVDGYELWSKYLYLSYMTLTTLGYGDITSENSIVQVWSAMEAVIGVLFQAILIARLVSLYGSRV